MRTERVAGSALAVLAALVCGAGLAGCGVAPGKTAAAVEARPTPPPSSGPQTPASAPASPPASAGAPPAPATSSPPPGNGGPLTPAGPGNAPAVHDPAAVPVTAPQVPGTVWLSPAQLPGGPALSWSAATEPTSTSDARLLVQDLWAPWCGGLSGFSTRAQATYTAGPIGATQYVFTFGDTAAATAAYQKVLAGRDACARGWKTMQPDSVMTRTAETADGTAWNWRWTGVATPATTAGAQQDREYLIHRGPVLAVVEIDEHLSSLGAAARVPAGADPGVLAALAAQLCAADKRAC